MKIVFFLSLLFLNHSLSLGQSFRKDRLIESIQHLIKKGDSLKNHDFNKALLYYNEALSIALDNKFNEKSALSYSRIGTLYYRNQEYIKSENMYKSGLRLKTIDNVAAGLFYDLALVKRKLNQQDSVLLYLEKSLILYKQFEYDKLVCNKFLGAGIIYKNRQLYKKSLEYLMMAYKGFESYDDKKKLASVCITIGNIQNHLKNYKQALLYHNQALKLETTINNKEGVGRCYANIANVNDNLKMLDTAIFNYKRALKLFNPQSSEYSTTLSNLADSYLKLGNISLAKRSFKESIKIHKSLKDTLGFLYSYNGLANLCLEKHTLTEAKLYLDSISNLTSLVSDQNFILDYYENQEEYCRLTKDYKRALAYKKKQFDLYESVYNSRQTEIFQNLQAQFEYEKRESKIQKLNLINKNTELKLLGKTKDLKNKNLTIVILLFFVFVLLVFYYIFIQKQKVVNQKTKIEKLEAIHLGQEAIKKRIARDLHDIITSNFDGLRFKILALKRASKVNELVESITNELKGINQQIRIVSHRLYPLELQISNRKFIDVIKSRLSEFQLYGNIFVELESPLPEVLNILEISIQNNFYGILLEVLNNVEKHSYANKIRIQNYIDKKENIHFIFIDNGIGIESEITEGIGLLSIKQRCEIINGDCVISKVKSGTKVHVQFPIKDEL